MNTIARRGFLQGVLTATAAGLLIPAQPREIEVFAAVPDKTALLMQPEALKEPEIIEGVLYDKFGTPVVMLTDVLITHSDLDASVWGDQQRRIMPSLRRIEVHGYGMKDFDPDKVLFK